MVELNKPGNHAIAIRTFRYSRSKNGDSITSRQVFETPHFIMGGVFGQAMYPTDIVKTVIEMFNLGGNTIHVNLEKTQDTIPADQNGKEWDMSFIDIYPVLDY